MNLSSLAKLSEDLESLAAKAAPSVVGIETWPGQGTGLVLAPDGYVITNAHVALASRRRAPRVRLLGGEALPAELVGADRQTDLAVLRIPRGGLTPLPLVESRRLKVGSLVVAIGNPFGFDRSVSLGVISALDRMLPGRRGARFEGMIQTDAAINPGNSGGPLLDVHGHVVGINTAVIPYAQGIGFAVPAQTANWVAAVLIRRGEIRRPRLGVSARGEDMAPSVVATLGQERALRIHSVDAGSPAARAGLREGDLLIQADDQPLYGIDDLQRVMVLKGDPEIRLEIFRQSERRQVSVRPEVPREAA